MLDVVAAVATAYLAASVSPNQVIARAYGVDLHRAGTRNLGGGNLTREVGTLQGISGGVLDALKPPVAMLAAAALGATRDAQLAAAVGAVAGQMWPIWHGFDGGRGNAPTIAALLALSLPAALLVAPLAAVGILWGVAQRARLRRRVYSKGTPLGLLAAFVAYPLAALAAGAGAPVALATAAIALLVVVRRLTAHLGEDLRASSDVGTVLLNRLLYDRSELQRRALERVS